MATPEQEPGIEFARAALARARAHARASMRPGWRRSSAPGRWGSRWGQDPDEPVYSGARPDGRDPSALGAALADLVALQGWGEPLTVATVTGRWEQIVGPDVAAHTTVEAFEVGAEVAVSTQRSATGGAHQVIKGATAARAAGSHGPAAGSSSLPHRSPSAGDGSEAAGHGAGRDDSQSAVAGQASAPSAVAARIVVRADSTAWATQLRLLLPALRRRLADELASVSGLVGADVRNSWQVEVTVLAPSAPSWRRGGRHVSGRGPRDTYG